MEYFYIEEYKQGNCGQLFSVTNQNGSACFGGEEKPPFNIKHCYAKTVTKNCKFKDLIFTMSDELILRKELTDLIFGFNVNDGIKYAPVTINVEKSNKQINDYFVVYSVDWAPEYEIREYKTEPDDMGYSWKRYVLDKKGIPQKDLFEVFLAGWVVSERLKNEIEKNKFTGIGFREVEFE